MGNELIDSKEHLNYNLIMFENFLSEGSDFEIEYMQNLLKHGKCFIFYSLNNEFRFAPSRFLGYKKNTPEIHVAKKDGEKHGTRTNSRINKILKQKLKVDPLLREKLVSYCASLGVKVDNKKHQFWDYTVNQTIPSSNSRGYGFPEGRIVERLHKTRERSTVLIKQAKEAFIKLHGKLFCEICLFDFKLRYKGLEDQFIEAHHTIPVSKMAPGYKSKIQELIMICPNCHRIAHRVRPWPTIQDLMEMIVK